MRPTRRKFSQMDGFYNPQPPAQLAYVVVTDSPPLAGTEHGMYRYTQANLKAALMCMGCKPRLAHKVSSTAPALPCWPAPRCALLIQSVALHPALLHPASAACRALLVHCVAQLPFTLASATATYCSLLVHYVPLRPSLCTVLLHLAALDPGWALLMQ